MQTSLLFVYNADSGLFNGLADMAHKLLSPQTYPCSLCGLTYSLTGMRRPWRDFVTSLGYPVEFLHRDELAVDPGAVPGVRAQPLPAVFLRDAGGIHPWITAAELNGCQTLGELQALISARLAAKGVERAAG